MRLPNVLFSIPFLLASLLSAQEAFVLHDGTAVKLRLSRNLSSADSKEGETIDFEVLEDVKIGDTTVVPRGSIAIGTVTEAQQKRRMARGGKLDLTIDYMRMADGGKVALRAVKQLHGGGHAGAMTGAIVATALVAWPAAPLFLLMHGKEAVIPKGTEITAYVNGESKLDQARFSGAPDPAPTAAPAAVVSKTGFTNDDVLQLKQAGFGDDMLVSKIRVSKPDYRLDVKDLIELKQAGISDTVIAAMVDTAKR